MLTRRQRRKASVNETALLLVAVLCLCGAVVPLGLHAIRSFTNLSALTQTHQTTATATQPPATTKSSQLPLVVVVAGVMAGAVLVVRRR